jgi:hypothetical protein
MMNGLKYACEKIVKQVVSSLPLTSNNTLALNEKLCYIIKQTYSHEDIDCPWGCVGGCSAAGSRLGGGSAWAKATFGKGLKAGTEWEACVGGSTCGFGDEIGTGWW